jgi:acyl-CoA reductase-like NAD-dependent aldehyde dehydrogenase
VSDYTPTTDEVRDSWADMRAEDIQQVVLAFAEFDRWLAERDAKVRAATLAEVSERVERSFDSRYAEWIDDGYMDGFELRTLLEVMA